MNRIPTEGLKHAEPFWLAKYAHGLNEQNPDRGIETGYTRYTKWSFRGLNEQNPDRGIETVQLWYCPPARIRLNEQNPDRGIET